MFTFTRFFSLVIAFTLIGGCRMGFLKKDHDDEQSVEPTKSPTPKTHAPSPATPEKPITIKQDTPPAPVPPTPTKTSYTQEEIDKIFETALTKVSASDKSKIENADITEWITDFSSTSHLGTCLAYFKIFSGTLDYRVVVGCIKDSTVSKLQVEAGVIASSVYGDYMTNPLVSSCLSEDSKAILPKTLLAHTKVVNFTPRPDQFSFTTAFLKIANDSRIMFDDFDRKSQFDFSGCGDSSLYDGEQVGTRKLHKAACQLMSSHILTIQQMKDAACIVQGTENVYNIVKNQVRVPNF